MKPINYLAVAIFTFSLISSATAQSTDRDHPTLLSSNEISGSLNNHNEEHFYSFAAGPGELTITVDVRAKPDELGNLSFELLDKNASTPILCCEGAQTEGGGTGRRVASIKLTKRQTIILHTTNGPVYGGTFRIRITGATSLSSSTKTEKNDGDNDNQSSGNNQPHGNQNGKNQVAVPASGTLHIRMKNGSTKDIDLTLVKDISIQP